jgi:hypothetical protein
MQLMVCLTQIIVYPQEGYGLQLVRKALKVRQALRGCEKTTVLYQGTTLAFAFPAGAFLAAET